MNNILDATGYKIGSIDEQGNVHDVNGRVLGRVSSDCHVFSDEGEKVGYFDTQGHIYDAGKHVATVHNDGKVYDNENHYLGKTEGGHLESGGAALVLLIR